MSYREKFSKRLSKLRKEKEATLQQLGDIAGISNQAISLLEKNKSAPGFEVLCSLADYFDVSLDYLVGRSNDPRLHLDKPDITQEKLMFDRNVFASRFKQLRMDKGLSQEELGEIFDLTKQAISDIERQRRTTTVEKLVEVARYFDVSIDYLVGESNDPTRYYAESSAAITDNEEIVSLKDFQMDDKDAVNFQLAAGKAGIDQKKIEWYTKIIQRHAKRDEEDDD